MQDLDLLLRKLECVKKICHGKTYVHGTGKNMYFSSASILKLCNEYNIYSIGCIEPFLTIDFENIKLKIVPRPSNIKLVKYDSFDNETKLYKYKFTKYAARLYDGIFSEQLIAPIEEKILNFISSKSKNFIFDYSNLPDKLKNLVLFT